LVGWECARNTQTKKRESSHPHCDVYGTVFAVL
jgi:hypothetical protein